MKWKGISTVMAGFAAGFAAASYVKEKQLLNSEKVLIAVKEKFSECGMVVDSWIVSLPEVFQNNVLSFDVYQGGLTLDNDGEIIRFEFVADAKTATVLQVETISKEED